MDAGGTQLQSGGQPRPGKRSWVRIAAAAFLLIAATLVASLQPPYPDANGYGGRDALGRLFYPLEINPTLRLAKVEGDLTGIAFDADGRNGVAVGDGGVLLSTDDGGRNWTAARSASGAKLNDVAISGNGEAAVAVGNDGAILLRSGSRSEWRTARAPAGNFSATAISDDGNRMVVVGPSGLIYASQDGGNGWIPSVGSFEGSDFRAVALSKDGRRGWLGGDEGILYQSADGGKNWSPVGRAAPVPSIGGPFSSAAAHRAGTIAVSYQDNADQGRAGKIVPAVYMPAPGQSPFRLIAMQEAPNAQAQYSKMPYEQSVEPTKKAYVRGTAPVQSFSPIPEPSKVPQKPRAAKPVGTVRTPSVRPTAPPPVTTLPVATLAPSPITALSTIGGSQIAGISGGRLFIDAPSGRTGGSFTALAMASDSVGWATGPAGAISLTTNRGESWQEQVRSTAGAINDLAALADGKHAWAAGAGGTILATTDGGAHWFAQLRTDNLPADAVYLPLPAPWFYLAFAIGMILMILAFRPVPIESHDGVAAMGLTDAPAGSVADDKLQFAALAKGISRFLRNEATRPPLTLAISGDWGTGKSSLMQMMCEDLRLHGNRPVWFNAWHHQDEEQLLAALLAAIRDKALPPWLSLRGLSFRAQLFWMRTVKAWPMALLLLFIGCALAAFFVVNGTRSWEQLVDLIGGLIGKGDGADKQTATNSLWVLPQVGSAVAIFAGLSKALKSFGTDPAVLLSKSVENFKLRDASAQVNFRTRFQSQFDEVTIALPYPLVIVIDDLDRCRPDTVLQVMESVNFLMSSGECFVVFGMATHRVQAALALSFKDIAQELVELDPVISEDLPPQERDKAEREKRRKYAGEYLQKLINLDIKVPSRMDIPPHLLLMQTDVEDELEDWISAAGERVKTYILPLAIAAAVAVAGWSLSSRFLRLAPAPAETSATTNDKGAGQATTQTAASPAAGSTAPASGAVAATSSQLAPAKAEVRVTPGRAQGAGWLWPIVLLAAALGLVLAVVRYRLRRKDEVVRDSGAFREALEAWTPVVARKTPSPRAIKRFGNRLRYFAMLQQAESSGPANSGGIESWLRRLTNLTGPTDVPAPGRAIDIVAEHRIVALGAIQALYGDDWRKRIESGFGQPSDSGGSTDDAVGLQAAVTTYVMTTRAGWPPSKAELDAFEHSLNGIRIGGATSVLSDSGGEIAGATPGVPGSSATGTPRPRSTKRATKQAM